MQRYRLKSDTLAIVFRDYRQIAHRIPAGAEIIVFDDVFTDFQNVSRQVQITLDGKTGMMFAVDIRERGEPMY